MEPDQTRALIEHQMQQRDVAVAEDRLGVGLDRLDVDQVEVAERRLAAVIRDDRAHLGITQKTVEFPGDLRRRSRTPPMAPPYFQERRPTHAESHPLEHGHRLLDVGLVGGGQRPGQRCDNDEISGRQGTGSKQMRQCGTGHRRSFPTAATTRYAFTDLPFSVSRGRMHAE